MKEENNVVDERALFEATEKARGTDLSKAWGFGTNGEYANPAVENRWKGFQEGRATLAPVAAQQADICRHGDKLSACGICAADRRINAQQAAAKAPAAQAATARRFDVQSIDTPEFRKLCDEYHCCNDQSKVEETYEAIYQHVDEVLADLAHAWKDSIAATPAAQAVDARLGQARAALQAIKSTLDDHELRQAASDALAEIDAMPASPASTPEASQQAAAVAAPSDELRKTMKPRALTHSLDDYWQAPSGVGPLAAAYKNKPHHLLYDLIAALLAAPTAGAATTSEDAVRLDFMADEECRIEVMAGPLYRLHWPDRGEWQREWSKTPREAIDAAMRATQQEGE